MNPLALQKREPKRDFDQVLNYVRQLHGQLVAMTPVTRDNLGYCDFPGVYLFSEGESHLYVGRSRKVKKRILQHSQQSSTEAHFAFRLARDEVGIRKPTYKKEGSRKELLKHAPFRAAFEQEKKRIAKMAIRYVRVDDSMTQALLEIYTSTVLDAWYNEFKTT